MNSIGFVKIFLFTSAVIIMETSGKLTTVSEENDEGSIFRCCPFNQYFNMETNHCEISQIQPETGAGEGSLEWQVPQEFLASWLQHKDEAENITLKWKERNSFPPCKKPLQTLELHLNSSFAVGETRYRLTEKGILLVTDGIETESFEPLSLNHRTKDFCIDVSRDNERIVIQICPPQCDKNEPCLRKCCEVGRHLEFDHEETEYLPWNCKSSPDTKWKLPLYEAPGVPLSDQTHIKPRYNTGFPLCENGFVVIATGHMLPDGVGLHSSFFVVHRALNSSSKSNWEALLRLKKDEKNWSSLNFHGDACYEKLEAHSKFSVCPGEDEIILYCPDTGNETKMDMDPSEITLYKVTDPWEIMYKVMSIVALLFLLVTILILLLQTTTKEVQNIHSWTRFAYVSSFFTVFLILTINAYWRPPLRSKSCAFLGGFLHFMALTTISWLSVINFDLWYCFKVLKPTTSTKLDVKRFLYYIAFAIGLPLIIIIIALVIQSYKPDEKLMCRFNSAQNNNNTLQYDNIITPNYGEKSCNLSSKALPTYWFTPLGILLLGNFLFLITTTCRMVQLQRMARRASNEKASGQRQSAQLFIKIFIVSGISWNFEIISWLLAEYVHKSKVKGAWYLLDLPQHFHAVALFVIFVCKKDVLRTLQTKFPIINKVIPQIGRHQTATVASCSTEVNSIRKPSVASSSGSIRKKESIELDQISLG